MKGIVKGAFTTSLTPSTSLCEINSLGLRDHDFYRSFQICSGGSVPSYAVLLPAPFSIHKHQHSTLEVSKLLITNLHEFTDCIILNHTPFFLFTTYEIPLCFLDVPTLLPNCSLECKATTGPYSNRQTMRGTNTTSKPYRKSSADNPPLSSSLEPEPSFFLRRRKTNRSSVLDDSEPVSPRFGATSITRQSGGSNKSNLEINTTSATSSLSLGIRFPHNVSDWNEKAQRETDTTSAELHPRYAADPPRPARAGYEWVWFPEGYWAERETPSSSLKKQRSRKWFNKSPDRQSNSSSPSKGQIGNKTPRDSEIPRIKVGGSKSRRGSSGDSQMIEDRSVRSSETLSSAIRANSPPAPLVSASSDASRCRRASAASLVRSAVPDIEIATAASAEPSPGA